MAQLEFLDQGEVKSVVLEGLKTSDWSAYTDDDLSQIAGLYKPWLGDDPEDIVTHLCCGKEDEFTRARIISVLQGAFPDEGFSASNNNRAEDSQEIDACQVEKELVTARCASQSPPIGLVVAEDNGAPGQRDNVRTRLVMHIPYPCLLCVT